MHDVRATSQVILEGIEVFMYRQQNFLKSLQQSGHISTLLRSALVLTSLELPL